MTLNQLYAYAEASEEGAYQARVVMPECPKCGTRHSVTDVDPLWGDYWCQRCNHEWQEAKQ
jgi:transposase-like protein